MPPDAHRRRRRRLPRRKERVVLWPVSARHFPLLSKARCGFQNSRYAGSFAPLGSVEDTLCIEKILMLRIEPLSHQVYIPRSHCRSCLVILGVGKHGIRFRSSHRPRIRTFHSFGLSSSNIRIAGSMPPHISLSMRSSRIGCPIQEIAHRSQGNHVCGSVPASQGERTARKGGTNYQLH